MLINRLIIVLLGTVACACGQLYLITGSPIPTSSEGFAASLFQVESDGVAPISELVPQKGSLGGITIDYDLGIALVLSETLIVIDLEKASIRKACASAVAPPHSGLIHQWLLNIPARGAVLADEFWDPEQRRAILVGTLLDSGVDCANSHVSLDPIDLRYVSAHGTPLIADAGGSDSDGLYASVESSGAIRGGVGGVLFPYGYILPPEQLVGLKQPLVWVCINNPQIMVITLSERDGERRVLAVRKSDGTWKRLPASSSSRASGPTTIPVMRAFGHFVAMAETLPKNAQNPESAGRAEWRKSSSKRGPDIAYMFREAKVAFPGILHLYDVDKDRTFTIPTKQGDSEILLVDNETVYYRVSDRLYSVVMTDLGLSAPHLIVTSEAIRDAHWAFIKH